MDSYINQLTLLLNWLLNLMLSVFNFMMDKPVLVGVIGLWILDRVFHIFDLIK